MITFPLTHRAYQERVARFLETGARPPEGVDLLGRWFTASHSRGFMLVETDDAPAIFQWVGDWADLIDFVVEPVVDDAEAAAVLQGART